MGLMNNPEFMNMMNSAARAANPAGTVVPSGGNQVKAIAEEMAALEAQMGTKEWNTNKAGQKRWEELFNAQQAMNG